MSYEGAIIDLDGTVYRGDALVPGAARGVKMLRERGIEVLFVSNKAIERREEYSKKLSRLGIPADPGDVITSATVTADYLVTNFPDRASFVVGERALEDELREAGLVVTDDPGDADAVVASMDREFDYETLTDAMLAMEGAEAFIATNPDRTCPVEAGEIPDAAGMIGAIEGVTGRSLDRVMGKPSQVTIDAATRRLGVDPADCLLIGDRLETDIEMGVRAGMTTVLVLSGVTSKEDLGDADVTPEFVLDSLGSVEEIFET